MGFFLGCSVIKVKAFFGSSYVAKQILFSMFAPNLSFVFDLISSLSWSQTGYFWAWGKVENMFRGLLI